MVEKRKKSNNRRRAILILILLILSLFVLSQLNWFWRMIYPLEYEDIIKFNACKYDLDPNLVAAIIFVESKYISTATSYRGAIGLMQIMPDTGKWIAEQLRYTEFREERLLDPKVNILFGCWYLSNLNEQFDDELVVVLAAYNAGRGNVKKWLDSEWIGKDTSLKNLPFSETRNYIKQVLSVYEKYQKIYNIELR
ncbi:MAG: lytic transglycosylase domain-containing protein [Halanaerobiaceae bacterium]